MKIKIKKESVVEFAKKRKTEILIILTILVLIVAITIILTNKNKNKTGNSISNLQNSGIATIQGNTIYYCKLGDKAGVYKIQQNGKNETKIKYTNASYLNAYKNYIYYLEQDEDLNTFNIIKSRKDGKEREKLVKEVDSSVITVADNWVYYFKDKVLHRIKTNGKDNMKVLDESILNYSVDGNYIYYIYNNGEKNILARKALDGTSFIKLAENVSKDFEIIGNNLYFVEQKYNPEEYEYNYTLYKMKQNGKNRRQILTLPNEIKNINITKNAIYYTTQNNNSIYNLYGYEYKGQEPVLLKELNVETKISVVGNWIFYIDLNENQEQEVLRINTL